MLFGNLETKMLVFTPTSTRVTGNRQCYACCNIIPQWDVGQVETNKRISNALPRLVPSNLQCRRHIWYRSLSEMKCRHRVRQPQLLHVDTGSEQYFLGKIYQLRKGGGSRVLADVQRAGHHVARQLNPITLGLPVQDIFNPIVYWHLSEYGVWRLELGIHVTIFCE